MTSETIMVAVNVEFTVRLKSTPTTGYVWDVHPLPEGVQLLGSEYEKTTNGMLAGGPVIQVFRFRAVNGGELIINFVLKRQWENDGIDSCSVTVKAD